jgi:hypothetical protein
MREKKIRLSTEEKDLLRTTRQEMFGDENVPYGVVVRAACRSLLVDDESNESEVSF